MITATKRFLYVKTLAAKKSLEESFLLYVGFVLIDVTIELTKRALLSYKLAHPELLRGLGYPIYSKEIQTC